jgi:deoxyribonuclease V
MEDLRNIQATQRAIAAKVRIDDSPDLKYVAKLGAFDVAYVDKKLICAGVVVEYPSMKLLEKKTIELPIPMKYIPGYLAFREGPAMLQLFYDLDYTPDLIFVGGHGIAHPISAGLASYIGIELEKPVIGVAAKLGYGEIVDGKIMVDGEQRGLLVTTKEHANPFCVSPGHLISIETAAEWVIKTTVAPHKKPEPLHIASRVAKKAVRKMKE